MYIRRTSEAPIDHVCPPEVEFGHTLRERASGPRLGERVPLLRRRERLLEMLISEEWTYEEHDGIGVCSYGHDE